MNRIRLTFLILLAIAAAYSPAVAQQSISSSNTSRRVSSHKRVIEPGYAWRMEMPLGTRVPAAIDTLMLDFATRAVPGMQFGHCISPETADSIVSIIVGSSDATECISDVQPVGLAERLRPCEDVRHYRKPSAEDTAYRCSSNNARTAEQRPSRATRQ